MTDEFTRQLTIMTFDHLRLAVPLSEVMSIERTVDIQPAPDGQSVLGHVQHRGYHYPAYGLTSRFELLSQIPDSWMVCVCLATTERAKRLAIICESVESVELDDTVVMQAMPDCMRSTSGPLQALCRYNEQLVVISKTDTLDAYMTNK